MYIYILTYILWFCLVPCFGFIFDVHGHSLTINMQPPEKRFACVGYLLFSGFQQKWQGSTQNLNIPIFPCQNSSKIPLTTLVLPQILGWLNHQLRSEVAPWKAVGTGYFPEWSIAVGWILATVPMALMLVASPSQLGSGRWCTIDGYGGFQKWWYPKKTMVSNGKS